VHQDKKPDWAKRRAGRIAKRCVPEVLCAIRGGYLSPSSADKVYRYLRPEEQRARVKRLVESKDRKVERCRVAVKILKAHVQSGTKDLHGLRKELAASLTW
jgi:hypothetical protein